LISGYGKLAPEPFSITVSVAGFERYVYAMTEPAIMAIATIAIITVYLEFIFSFLVFV
jgi:hypothetical protein